MVLIAHVKWKKQVVDMEKKSQDGEGKDATKSGACSSARLKKVCAKIQ